MYHSMLDFAKAYQADLLRSVIRERISAQNSPLRLSLWAIFLNRLGDTLIDLGERVKCQGKSCVELSHKPA